MTMNLQTLRVNPDFELGINGRKDDETYIISDNDDADEEDRGDTDTGLADEFDEHALKLSPLSKSFRDKKAHQYHMMINMTLELVRDMTMAKKNDKVLTNYGEGVLLSRNGVNGSMEIQLPFGKLFHRQPEMVHKLISPAEYEQAIEHLEEVRKLSLTELSQQWNVPIVIGEACIACLFDKPFCKTGKGISSDSTTIASRSAAAFAKSRNMRSWFGRFSSASTSTVQSNSNVAASLVKEQNGMLKKKKKTTRTKFCDVCGNPVCSKHIIPSTGGQQFRMCVDCQFDFSQMFETTSSGKMTQGGVNSNLLDLDHIPHLTQTLDRLLTYYTRMSLHLTFCAPNLRELAERLTRTEHTNSKIALGTGGISFVGAALGVAGAAALLTPAGPPLLLAAVATSASSAAIQGGQAGYNALFNMSLKEANQLADRIIGWHGLCLGILDALEQLRQTLLQQVLAITQEERNSGVSGNSLGDTGRIDSFSSGTENTEGSESNTSDDGLEDEMALARKNAIKHGQQLEKDALLLRQVVNSRSRSNKSTAEQSLDVLNTLALGTYHTTRNGLTGVGLTASMGASYSQMLNASIQTVPVVGGAFSLGCMAMDASNIASTLQKLQKPASKAIALHQVLESFTVHIPSTIQSEVEALLGAINELKERQEVVQRNQQQDLIEQELEELNNI